MIFQFGGGETRVRYGIVIDVVYHQNISSRLDHLNFVFMIQHNFGFVHVITISFFASNGRRFNRFRMCCGIGTRLCIVSFVLITLPKEVQIAWLSSDERCSTRLRLETGEYFFKSKFALSLRSISMNRHIQSVRSPHEPNYVPKLLSGMICTFFVYTEYTHTHLTFAVV